MSSRGNDRRRHGRRGGGGGGSGSYSRPKKAQEQPDIDETSPVIQAFRQYQSELDTRHDKHERLVKLSRDITIESKRAIFLLQRIAVTEAEKTLNEAEAKFVEIRATKWRTVAKELLNEDSNQFMKAYSAGLQEYVEAVSFWYYLKNDTLISCQQIQDDLIFHKDLPAQPVEEELKDTTGEVKDEANGVQEQPKDNTPSSSTITPADNATTDSTTTTDAITDDVATDDAITHDTIDSTTTDDTTPLAPGGNMIVVNVPPIEYMLGVADLTGELMRLAISAVGKGQLDTPAKTCDFMRIIYDAFLSYGNVSRELSRKMSTLKQSLGKVENACYMLQVRGSEVPKHMLVDVICATNTGDYVEIDDE